MTNKIDGSLPPRSVDRVTIASKATDRAGVERSAPTTPAPAVDSMRLTGEAAELRTLAREMSAEPAGIDQARVEQIRTALADGSYRVDSKAIANGMLAFERELLS